MQSVQERLSTVGRFSLSKSPSRRRFASTAGQVRVTAFLALRTRSPGRGAHHLLGKSEWQPFWHTVCASFEFDVARKDCHTPRFLILNKKLEKSPKTAYTQKEWKTRAEVGLPGVHG